jgi:hypothetical protein
MKMNKGLTKYEIAIKMVALLKRENEKMASLLPNYKPSQEDLDDMIFLNELFNNQFIKEE